MAPKTRLVLLAAALHLVAAAGQVRGDLLPLGPILPSVTGGNPMGIISGMVPCSSGSNIIPTAAVPPFANATVQPVCGNTVVANATTGATGAFTINVGVISTLVPAVGTSLLSGQCRLVVATPLVACNASLAGATGVLSAPLQLVNSTTGGVITTTTTIFGFTVMTTNGVISFLSGPFSSIA